MLFEKGSVHCNDNFGNTMRLYHHNQHLYLNVYCVDLNVRVTHISLAARRI